MKLKESAVLNSEEVKHFLETTKTKLALYFEDIWLNQANMTHPYDYFLNSKFFYVDYNEYKKEFLEMPQVSFETNDDDILISIRQSH